jgi:hypothetical protein
MHISPLRDYNLRAEEKKNASVTLLKNHSFDVNQLLKRILLANGSIF